MDITHRVINIQKYLIDVQNQDQFVVGVQVDDSSLKERFDRLEITNSVEAFSPKISNGINAERNILGEFRPDKSQPKEIAYRAHHWKLKDWGGNWHEGTTPIAYQRYPRIFIEPYSVKFVMNTLATGEKILIANSTFQKDRLTNQELTLVKFIVNLLVEAVGKAEIFPLDSVTEKPVRIIKTVDWRIIPKGERIWDFVKSGIEHVSKSEKTMIKERFEVLESYLPDEMYKGLDSYTGYVVFYYKNKGLYIFDSIIYGQATYVFDGNWKEVSQLTKKQIIDNQIAKARIVHNKHWNNRIAQLLI